MRYVLILLWLLLGPAYYFIAKSCSQTESKTDSKEKMAAVVPSIHEEVPCPRIGPFAFERSSADLLKTNQWNSYIDSLQGLLTKDKKIQIIGLFAEGESQKEDLGMERAHAIADAIGLPSESIQVYSSNIGKPKYKIDCQFPGARIKLVTVTKKIKEIKDRTLIYFPYNSTNKLNDKEVEIYLDALAGKIIESNQKVQLTGHTDNEGDPDYNLKLGQSRAEVIKNYLLSQNVPAQNVITLSRGELEPIEDNDTKEGRAQNRRTELKIIN